jgi:hypothetical protein
MAIKIVPFALKTTGVLSRVFSDISVASPSCEQMLGLDQT